MLHRLENLKGYGMNISGQEMLQSAIFKFNKS
ncbi:MAG: hypothetical protein ACFWT6_18045 [Virgibacillus proomii]|jgi:hypothetical protein